jgi:hypothetical protein
MCSGRTRLYKAVMSGALVENDDGKSSSDETESGGFADLSATMGRTHRFEIPMDTLFRRSPKVVLETDDAKLASYVRRVVNASRSQRNDGVAYDWQCYTRKASVPQRNGHLARLEGVIKLEQILRWAQDDEKSTCEVFMYGQVRWLLG